MDAALLRSDVRGTVDRLLAQGFVTIEGHAEAEAADGDDVVPAPPLDPQRWRPDDRPGPGRRAVGARQRAEGAGRDVGDRAVRRCRGRRAPAPVALARCPRSPGRRAWPTTSCRSCRAVPPGGSGSCSTAASSPGSTPRRRRSRTPSTTCDELAVEGSPAALLFHARGRSTPTVGVVVVLGVSGQGKSTVTAALVQRGFRYLSDEVVAVDVATREVRPYPKGARPATRGPRAARRRRRRASVVLTRLEGEGAARSPRRGGHGREARAPGVPGRPGRPAPSRRSRSRVRRGASRSRPRRRSWRSCP